MRSCNPLVIPRNHLVEEALVEAEAGNKKPFFTLLHALKTPYEGYENAQLQTIPYGVDVGYKTFCGT